MAKDERKKSVLIVEPTGIRFLLENEQNPLVWQFPAGTVADMEIKDVEQFRDGLEDFLHAKNLNDHLLILIISQPLLFTQPFVVKSKADQEIQEKAFVDIMPFERVAYKIYKTSQDVQIMALNRDFYDSIRMQLLKANNNIQAVLPQNVMMALIGNQTTPQAIIKSLFDKNKQESLKMQTLIAERSGIKTFSQKQEEFSQKHTLIVFGAFAIFLALLGFATWKALQLTAPKPTPVKTSAPTSTTAPSPSLSPNVVASASAIRIATGSAQPSVATSSAQAKRVLRIQVLNGSGVIGQAELVATQLQGKGFTSVTTGNAGGTQRTGTLISVDKSVSEELRQELVTVLSEILENVTIAQQDDLSFPVIVTTGE